MIKFLGDMLRPYKKLVAAVLLLQIAGNFLSLYLPAINAEILNYGVANSDIPYIVLKGGLMILLSLLQIVCSVFASVLGAKAALSAGRNLREKMYARILSLSQKEIGLFGAPTLVTRATNDIQQVIQFVTYLFTIIISAPIMFLGGIGMAAALDLSLSMVIICMLPVFAVISIWFVVKIIPYYRVQQEKIDKVNAVLRDQISGVRVVKAFVKEEHEKERMEEVSRDLLQLNVSIGRVTSIMSPLFLFIVNIVVIILMWYGGVRAEAGHAQIGTIVAMVTYASFILSAVMLASMIFILLPRADVSAGRIMEVLSSKSSVNEAADPVSADKLTGRVTFENAGFSYAPDHQEVAPVLGNLSFEALPGQTTAIIGSTGCGKTTLLNLIVRLMDVTEGSVKIDGTDVRKMKIPDLRAAIGLVPQKAFLFSGTLAKNLRYAKPDATDEELWAALEIAQAADFVRAGGGLELPVSEGGSNFSGGQKQRLAIARAIVRKPSIYIFDDSFSALDYSTDRKLRSALREITKASTVIIVAQRISSIIDASKIIVLNNGKIEDMGRHEELLKRCRTYQEIASSQLSEEVGEEA